MAPAAVAILPQLLPAEADTPYVIGGLNGHSGCQVADRALAMRAIWQHRLLFYFEGSKSKLLCTAEAEARGTGEQPGSRTSRLGGEADRE